jgi:hypothetical protein
MNTKRHINRLVTRCCNNRIPGFTNASREADQTVLTANRGDRSAAGAINFAATCKTIALAMLLLTPIIVPAAAEEPFPRSPEGHYYFEYQGLKIALIETPDVQQSITVHRKQGGGSFDATRALKDHVRFKDLLSDATSISVIYDHQLDLTQFKPELTADGTKHLDSYKNSARIYLAFSTEDLHKYQNQSLLLDLETSLSDARRDINNPPGTGELPVFDPERQRDPRRINPNYDGLFVVSFDGLGKTPTPNYGWPLPINTVNYLPRERRLFKASSNLLISCRPLGGCSRYSISTNLNHEIRVDFPNFWLRKDWSKADLYFHNLINTLVPGNRAEGLD